MKEVAARWLAQKDGAHYVKGKLLRDLKYVKL